MKTTKAMQVRLHLRKRGSITTWDAIKLYGATRLSAIIFNLRESGWDIESEWKTSTDRNGNTSRYTIYKLNSK